MRLQQIIIPVAHAPSPLRSLTILASLLAPLGVLPKAFRFLHIGDHRRNLDASAGTTIRGAVEIRKDPVVETILHIAQVRQANMKTMPTSYKGFLDALRGSTAFAASPVRCLPFERRTSVWQKGKRKAASVTCSLFARKIQRDSPISASS